MKNLSHLFQNKENSQLVLSIILAIWLFLDVFSVLIAPPENLVCRLEDDAFFYCTIARNTVAEGIISFDGFSKTNGFHPLWMGTLIAVNSAVPDSINFLRAVSILSALLMFTAGLVAVRILRKQYSLVVILLTFIILFRYVRDFTHLAMETSILLPLAIYALYLLDRISQSSSKRSLLLLGGILPLVGLARLDAALLALLIGVWAVVLRKDRLSSALLLFSPGIIIGLAYLIVNKIYFNSWMSVSSGIKSSSLGFNTLFAKQLFLFSDPMGLRSPWGLFLLFFILSFVAISFRNVRPSVKVVSLFLILFTISQLFLSPWRLWFWYAYPAVLFTVFVLPLMLEKLVHFLKLPSRLLKVVSSILLILACTLSVTWGWNYKEGNPEDFRARNMLIAEELNLQMDDSTLIAIGDRAGSFAYFFRGGVVQMEGLAGSAELVDFIQQKMLHSYLVQQGIDYIISWTGPHNQLEYSVWELHIPDNAQCDVTPNIISIFQEDEIRRWLGTAETVFLWKFNGSQIVR